ncbi:MAG: futalosine hydrolase [Daejeonella sp.]
MKLLLVVATRAEIEPLQLQFQDDNKQDELLIHKHSVRILTTGVGMVATAFSLGKHLTINQYDLAINLGIAGSFDFNLALGDVVQITEDTFAELGAENGNEFLTINELGFGENKQLPLNNPHLESNQVLQQLKQVTAITVNKVHGNELSISKMMQGLKPQTESMEGAAFFYACNQTSTPCIQIRAISNHIERRDREKWNIGLAIKNLNMFAQHFLENI